jgi:hypothetical protein
VILIGLHRELPMPHRISFGQDSIDTQDRVSYTLSTKREVFIKQGLNQQKAIHKKLPTLLFQR